MTFLGTRPNISLNYVKTLTSQSNKRLAKKYAIQLTADFIHLKS
jgi:hypothetical protein